MTTLTTNAMKWLSNGKAEPKIAARKNVKTYVKNMVMNISTSQLAGENVDIYCIGHEIQMSNEEIKNIVDFVERGGSVMYASNIWYWANNGKRPGDR